MAVEEKRIRGFVTVSPGHLESDDPAAALGRRLPRYPLPVLRLARLAMDESSRGRGVGAGLLSAVFALALRMAADYGCVGIAVDAKPQAIAFYAKYGFTAKSEVSGGLHVAPKPTPMFLSIARIRKAQPGE